MKAVEVYYIVERLGELVELLLLEDHLLLPLHLVVDEGAGEDEAADEEHAGRGEGQVRPEEETNRDDQVEPPLDGLVEDRCVVDTRLEDDGAPVPLEEDVALEDKADEVDLGSVAAGLVENEAAGDDELDHDAHKGQGLLEGGPGDHIVEAVREVQHALYHQENEVDYQQDCGEDHEELVLKTITLEADQGELFRGALVAEEALQEERDHRDLQEEDEEAHHDREGLNQDLGSVLHILLLSL